jgi:hypothetical protein
MLTANQLQKIASDKMLNAKISKPQIAAKLKQEAKDLKEYADLINRGYTEAQFLKMLKNTETEIKRREDTFLGIMEHNREQAKEYHKESNLKAFESKANLLKVILQINN